MKKEEKMGIIEKLEAEQLESEYDAWIFTDGGCRNNGNNAGEHVLPTDKAAWAYVILHDGKAITATGGKVGATNNQMEMTAVLESLKALEDMELSQ